MKTEEIIMLIIKERNRQKGQNKGPITDARDAVFYMIGELGESVDEFKNGKFALGVKEFIEAMTVGWAFLEEVDLKEIEHVF